MEENQYLKGFYLYLLLTAIALTAFAISLDGFIVNVAIPTIAGELGVREDAGTWIITLFAMMSTACIPLAGSLSYRIGDYPLFIFGTTLFFVASFLSGISPNFTFLLFGRVFQGAAAGILTPVSLALIVKNFPPEKRSIAVGFWSFFVMVGPAMGPMIGGWLSDYRWHWMFFINIPVCIFSLLIVTLLTKQKHEKRERLPLDIIGILLLFTCIITLQVATNRWNIYDWFQSPAIVTLFVVAGVCLVFFIAWEFFHPLPFIDLFLLKNRNFTLASFTTALAMGLLFSSFVLDSLWVQEVLGYTPAWAGLTLSPVGIFPLIFYPLMGRFVNILDVRIWVILSFLLYACTFYWLSHITVYTPFWNLALPRLVQGIGFAMFTVPNALVATRGAPPERYTFVVSIFSFCRMLFVSFGVALAITLWIFRQTFYQTRMSAKAFASNPHFIDLKNTFYEVTHSVHQSIALSYNTIVNESSTLALADIYYLYAWIFLGLCIPVLFYKSIKQ